MDKKYRFQSILAPFITGFLDEKHSLGFDYHTEELLLIRFDKYCIQKGLDTLRITRGFFEEWCMQTDTEGLSQHKKRINAVRQLMLYIISLGIMVYIPKACGRNEVVLPHIFTQDELLVFIYEADNYKPLTNRVADLRLANEYRVLFRLLYCCGLRNSEGCGIAKDQVDLDKGILTILDSKGNKDRLVYMADDLLELCRDYYQYLCNELAGSPRWFFPGENPDKPLCNTTVDRAFNRFWERTKFHASCNNKPTVHDLRFTYVTDRINLWASMDVPVDIMMPYLQKYVGHKNLQDSYYYYHNTNQLYESIRIKDKTAGMVIPEVTSYE